jgi:hypothetical protein
MANAGEPRRFKESFSSYAFGPLNNLIAMYVRKEEEVSLFDPDGSFAPGEAGRNDFDFSV